LKFQNIPKEGFLLCYYLYTRNITIKIFSTWGDRFYVGLNGIELCDEKGSSIELKDPFK